MDIIVPYPKLSELRTSLAEYYKFPETRMWNCQHISVPEKHGKGGLFLFYHREIQFMRGLWKFDDPTAFVSTDRVGKYNIVDFRIGSTRQIHSAYLEGSRKYEWDITTVDGIRLFFPEKCIQGKKTELMNKFQRYNLDSNISKLVDEILDLQPKSFEDSVKLEWKFLEFSFFYLEFLNKKDISRHFSEVPLKHVHAIRTAQHIIDQHYNQRLSIEKLGKEVGLNIQYLKKGFKKLMGYTIKQYCIKVRMEKAREMVIHEEYPIWDICHKVGYHNQGYFIRLYKKVYGLTPMQHRLQEQADRFMVF
ncbi:MAG: AraC family transcriptional regulator [Bacteroidota bacterium]